MKHQLLFFIKIEFVGNLRFLFMYKQYQEIVATQIY